MPSVSEEIITCSREIASGLILYWHDWKTIIEIDTIVTLYDRCLRDLVR